MLRAIKSFIESQFFPRHQHLFLKEQVIGQSNYLDKVFQVFLAHQELQGLQTIQLFHEMGSL